jgi:hypothetical protein
MNDMTPIRRPRPPVLRDVGPLFLTADRAKAVLEAAGALRVSVLDRHHKLVAFFRLGREPVAWIIEANVRLPAFEQYVARELSCEQPWS